MQSDVIYSLRHGIAVYMLSRRTHIDIDTLLDKVNDIFHHLITNTRDNRHSLHTVERIAKLNALNELVYIIRPKDCINSFVGLGPNNLGFPRSLNSDIIQRCIDNHQSRRGNTSSLTKIYEAVFSEESTFYVVQETERFLVMLCAFAKAINGNDLRGDDDFPASPFGNARLLPDRIRKALSRQLVKPASDACSASIKLPIRIDFFQLQLLQCLANPFWEVLIASGARPVNANGVKEPD
ncbi:hypothetical protein PMI38_04834 [Pseudomonas sp. GM84]|nr:hypothetical protein PMI38_04834 [Pseudomonas sp. GM84]